jgi:hypothetical protein
MVDNPGGRAATRRRLARALAGLVITLSAAAQCSSATHRWANASTAAAGVAPAITHLIDVAGWLVSERAIDRARRVRRVARPRHPVQRLRSPEPGNRQSDRIRFAIADAPLRVRSLASSVVGLICAVGRGGVAGVARWWAFQGRGFRGSSGRLVCAVRLMTPKVVARRRHRPYVGHHGPPQRRDDDPSADPSALLGVVRSG